MGINPRGSIDVAPVANNSLSCSAILKVAMVLCLGSLASKPSGEPSRECRLCSRKIMLQAPKKLYCVHVMTV